MARRGTLIRSQTNRYTVLESIGNGANGDVFKVYSSDNRQLALKLLSREASEDTDKVKRFKQEIEYCSNTRNSGIVHVLDRGNYLDEATNQPFYIMPLYNNDLGKLMEEDLMPKEALFKMLKELLSKVAEFHSERNIHRDVKPKNILYDAERGRLILADFGIAHITKDYPGATVKTKTSDRLANFKYAAPEQCDPKQKVDKRADIFAFGLIINEIFTGEIPRGMGAKRPSSFSKEYEYLDTIVEKMTAQHPEERHASLYDVLADIENKQCREPLDTGDRFYGVPIIEF